MLFGLLAGVVFAPLATLRAFRAARGGRALFALREEDYGALLDLSVGQLRARLGVPPAGLAQRPRRLHSTAPAG